MCILKGSISFERYTPFFIPHKKPHLISYKIGCLNRVGERLYILKVYYMENLFFLWR